MTTSGERDLSPSSSLCLECGLCCDGSIFSHVELSLSDCDRLGVDHSNSSRLYFPCQHLDGKRCSIYPSRPKICASYRCKTLTALENGDISPAEAHYTVHRAAKLGHEFEQAIPTGMTRKQAIVCVVTDQCPQEASDEQFLRLRLAYVALQAMVDRHMRHKGDKVVRSAMHSN